MRERPTAVRTLGDLTEVWKALWGSALAVGGIGEASTFAELDSSSKRWAAALRRNGFGPGARVALWGGNSAAWMARAFGAWRAGCTLVPLSTFATARELGEILNSARPDVIVADRFLRTRDFGQILSDVTLPSTVRHIVLADGARLPGVETEERFLRAYGDPGTGQTNLARAQDTAVILYTSGTTGTPKGVRLQHRAVLSTMRATIPRGGLRPGDSVISSLPLFWVAGLCIRALPTLASGSALLVMKTFDVEELIELLRRSKPTGLHLRPPQVGALLSHPEFDPALLRRVRRGGGRNDWYRGHLKQARLITGYGMTEMSGYVTAVSWRDPAGVRANSIGRLLPKTTVRIVGGDGRDCGVRGVGEIRVRGPGLFDGYEGQPPGAALDAEGYFCTGDLGFVDESGQLHFVGRRKDLVRCKGVNVSPVEVENVLAQHPTVEAAFVVGLPPGGLDQQLVALVVSRDGRNHEASWREWCEKTLSTYKRPASFVLLQRHEVPLGPTSKPQRDRLAALAMARLERERQGAGALPGH